MSDNLLSLAKKLAENHRVIIPDLINHGQSPHREAMTYPLMAKDVIQLLDHLDIYACKIMGHSMGGKVTMQLAHDFPDRVTTFIIADIAPVDYPPKHSEILEAMLEVDTQSIKSRREAESVLELFIKERALRQFFLKNMAKNTDGLWQWRFGLHEINKAYTSISAAPDLRHSIMQNCLFIKGGASDYIVESHGSVIKQFFPHAQFKIINNAGHWLHAEKPLIFNRLVCDFFASKE